MGFRCLFSGHLRRRACVRHVQELQYLNLAMNKISRIENLEGCESLEKLDMTMNKIGVADLPTIANLRNNAHLHTLYLLGNPCTTWIDHRLFVVAMLPRLQRLVRVALPGHDALSCARLLKILNRRVGRVKLRAGRQRHSAL